jgi:hypothetical protein
MMMETGKTLIPLLASTMKKGRPSYPPLESDFACSGATDKCVHLIRDKFGYNSEKPFDESLFFKKLRSEGRWQQ